MKLYDYNLSGSCYKVRLLLSFLELDFDTEAVDFFPGRAHKAPEFLKINPLGQLPVLDDGDIRLRDAQAILVYLASKYDKSGIWYPQDAETQGKMAMWLSFAGNEIMTASGSRLVKMLNYPLDGDALKESACNAFRILDDHLANQERLGEQWVATKHPTIADIACFPYVALCEDANILLDEYPAIDRWLDRLMNLPNFVEMSGILPPYRPELIAAKAAERQA